MNPLSCNNVALPSQKYPNFKKIRDCYVIAARTHPSISFISFTALQAPSIGGSSLKNPLVSYTDFNLGCKNSNKI